MAAFLECNSQYSLNSETFCNGSNFDGAFFLRLFPGLSLAIAKGSYSTRVLRCDFTCWRMISETTFNLAFKFFGFNGFKALSGFFFFLPLVFVSFACNSKMFWLFWGLISSCGGAGRPRFKLITWRFILPEISSRCGLYQKFWAFAEIVFVWVTPKNNWSILQKVVGGLPPWFPSKHSKLHDDLDTY